MGREDRYGEDWGLYEKSLINYATEKQDCKFILWYLRYEQTADNKDMYWTYEYPTFKAVWWNYKRCKKTATRIQIHLNDKIKSQIR